MDHAGDESLTTETGPTRWGAVKEILADALAIDDPATRTAFLEQACGGDSALQSEIELLLAQNGDEIDSCADYVPRRPEASLLGHLLGSYRILREIGRGGMGAVYLAERADGEFEKQVAIKMLKRGTDTDEVLRRFRAERRVVARLDHPHIARLLDAGTSDHGLPYFVMEYVDGKPITQYAREAHLSLSARLQLFLKVCGAVQLAHEQGIVHRDLKPGNILVRRDGEPKLLDFGIAKLLAPSNESVSLTLTEQRRLTPACASPEQTRGEPVKETSDVYALGALLYELLTERSPHCFANTSPSSDEITRVIGEVEPIRPSLVSPKTAGRTLRGDLDTILLMALRKEPARRYSSVAEFAEEIRRHLDGRAIHARGNSVGYRAQRYLSRNRQAIAAALALAAVIATLFFLAQRPSAITPVAGSAAPEKSIAVLPFENLSEEKANSFFADGVQDEILSDLSRLKDLKVISRTSVMQYKNAAARNLRDIAQQLGVAHVLEGTVQRSGDRIRVSAQLIDARTDAHLWAEHYERDLADVFAIQNEIARTIAEQLQAKISPNEKNALQQNPTTDLVAYDLYLRAKALRDEVATSKDWEGDTRRAVDLLDQAVTRDPDFALAYCLLCKLNFTLYAWVDKTPARLALVESAVKNAIRVAPESGETYLVRGRWFMHEMDWPRALDAITHAAQLLPGSVDALRDASDVEERLGRWSEATRDLEKAKELDPANPNIPNSLTGHYSARREYARSDQVADAAIARFPNGPGYFRAAKVRNAIYRGDLKAARIALAAIAPGWDPSGYVSDLRVTVAVADRNYEEAAQLLAATRKENLIDFSEVDLGFFEVLVAREQNDDAKAKAVLVAMREKAEAHLRDLPNDIPLLSRLARIDAYLGRNEEAIREIQRASELARDAIGGPEVTTIFAEVQLRAGERDKALELLSEAAKIPCGPSYGELLGPRWDALRDDRRFQEIVEQLALTAKK